MLVSFLRPENSYSIWTNWLEILKFVQLEIAFVNLFKLLLFANSNFIEKKVDGITLSVELRVGANWSSGI